MATCLWVAPGQENHQSCEESKEEEDTELHGPNLTAFQFTAVPALAFYPDPASPPSYVTSSIPRLPSVIAWEHELERGSNGPIFPVQCLLSPDISNRSPGAGRDMAVVTKVSMSACESSRVFILWVLVSVHCLLVPLFVCLCLHVCSCLLASVCTCMIFFYVKGYLY